MNSDAASEIDATPTPLPITKTRGLGTIAPADFHRVRVCACG
jgi:hypothetical protein